MVTPIIEGAERILSPRVLGVLLDSKLSLSDHITATLNTCSSSTYALRLLLSHGLQPRDSRVLMAFSLESYTCMVARAITVCLNALRGPSLVGGFASEGDRQRIERLVARMRRSGYLPSGFPDLATPVEEADCTFYQ